jgi:hypothetical protein
MDWAFLLRKDFFRDHLERSCGSSLVSEITTDSSTSREDERSGGIDELWVCAAFSVRTIDTFKRLWLLLFVSISKCGF